MVPTRLSILPLLALCAVACGPHANMGAEGTGTTGGGTGTRTTTAHAEESSTSSDDGTTTPEPGSTGTGSTGNEDESSDSDGSSSSTTGDFECEDGYATIDYEDFSDDFATCTDACAADGLECFGGRATYGLVVKFECDLELVSVYEVYDETLVSCVCCA